MRVIGRGSKTAIAAHRLGSLGLVLGLTLAVLVGLASFARDANALVFSSPATEPKSEIPEDFPYWENVTQRRYNSPSVLYLGHGWAMTARHVGTGEIFLEGEIIKPEPRSRRTLLNIDGSPADAMLFQLDEEAVLPDLPVLPLAKHPPRIGEEVLLIGFGRGRERVVEWTSEGVTQFGFEWTRSGAKRWGTNRITSVGDRIHGGSWTTQAISFAFDPPLDPRSTRHEAHAATGDSGGAVFVRRGGDWELVGLMISVSGYASTPSGTSTYGDVTYAADISVYRSEILRYTRPACSNEEDDDGDRRIDFPLDPGCDSAADRNERDGDRGWLTEALWSLGAFLVAGGLAVLLYHRLRRPPRG